MGWQIGPAITSVGLRYKQRKVKMSGSDVSAYELEWKNIVTEALVATAIAVIATASLVFLTNINFSFLGGFLFIALIILILMSLANLLLFKSRLVSLARAYLGVVVFTLYLLYDFNRLEKMAGDDSWGAAVDIAVNIYLDIINLFLQLLEILAETSD